MSCKIEMAPYEKVVAVVPQCCYGPGWANTPIWVHIVNHGTGTHRVECIQPEEQTAEMRILFRTLESAHSEMLHQVQKLVRIKKPKKTS